MLQGPAEHISLHWHHISNRAEHHAASEDEKKPHKGHGGKNHREEHFQHTQAATSGCSFRKTLSHTSLAA